MSVRTLSIPIFAAVSAFCVVLVNAVYTVAYVHAESVVSEVHEYYVVQKVYQEELEVPKRVRHVKELADSADTEEVAAMVASLKSALGVEVQKTDEVSVSKGNDTVPTVPFYSQFSDISAPEWRKVGCGIASLAMLIDFYTKSVSVDTLLSEGLQQGAYLDDAGWVHSGLIKLAEQYGLKGRSQSLSGLSQQAAFAELKEVLKDGPVMVSIHYLFEPTNPIPHLVVVSGVRDGKVYYNDPADVTGGHSISIDKFIAAWKQRYIEIRGT